MAPVSVVGWVLVLTVYGWVTPGLAAAEGIDWAVGGLGLASAALALAALAGRLPAVRRAGGAAALAGVGWPPWCRPRAG